MTLCDVWTCFSIVFLWRWRSKVSVVLKLEWCEHKDDTYIVDGDQEGVKCQLSFVLKGQVKKVPPWVEGWSYVAVLVVCEVWEVCWILKGFWLCQCFCHVMDLWNKCEMLLLLSDVGCCSPCLLLWNLLSSAFGCFVEMWWFLMAQMVWFLWCETISLGTCLFHQCFWSHCW